jgi:mannan endo-1,4-beta-mannosidase
MSTLILIMITKLSILASIALVVAEKNALSARDAHIYRDGTVLRLQGERWTASGANVYWLGLDENVIPPTGAAYYAPLKASYPTQGRITEAMATLAVMGARLIRGHTLGVSVGNPLSMMPSLGVYNEAAFEPMDWAVYQARQHDLRIFAPLTDNYVCSFFFGLFRCFCVI